ncbi:MAG: type II secretion system protein GspD, partial [Acetobacteraceae bacterium]|nr:type II secretion system protein GspD [Acetobacteraceae bacterium]
QDGQTLGLAGLIQDSNTTGNSGIPWIKDVPILGLLASTQNNTRSRTELLIMLTPHVIRDQNAVRAAAEDMREVLHNAAELPYTLNGRPVEGSADPDQPLRNKIDSQMNRWFGQ